MKAEIFIVKICRDPHFFLTGLEYINETRFGVILCAVQQYSAVQEKKPSDAANREVFAMKKFLAMLTAAMCTVSLVPAAAVAADTNVNLEQETDGRLEITEAGTYVLTGSMQGTVYVDPGVGEVELILDGVDINGGISAGIAAVSGDGLTVTMPEGSVNRVSDGGSDQLYTAAIYSAVPVTFAGNGTLYVIGNNQQGIVSENADLTFNGGNYTIKAATYGLAIPAGKTGRLTINDGYFRIRGGSGSIDPATATVMNGGQIEEITDTETGTGNTSQTTDTAVSYAGETSGSTAADSSAAGTAAAAGNTAAETEKNATEENTASADAASESAESVSTTEGNSTENTAEDAARNAETQNGTGSGEQNGMPPQEGMMQPDADGQFSGQPGENGQFNGQFGPGQAYGQELYVQSADSPSEITEGTTTNSAADLEADLDNATYVTMTDDDSQVKITSSGTYVVSGSSADGNITVKKGTTGVVLVLDDLDLTSTTGAAVSVNKEAEVKIVIAGEVVLTDAENPDDEYSEDADVADAYDGAALKAKANSQVYVTGDGTLTINGNAKNGIKAGDDSSLIFDGVTVNITAANDGINGNYDVSLLSGNFTIAAGDDAIHADHILTVGEEDGTGPVIRVTESNEGLEGTVVNVYGGDISVVSADDAINAANGDGLYEGELDYSFNMMGGRVRLNSSGDGIDSNGDINLIDGSMEISSAQNGGEAGIDYDGQLYIADDFDLNNGSGVAGPDGMGGQPQGMSGPFGGMDGLSQDMNGQPGEMNGPSQGMNGQPGEMNGRFGGMNGQPGGMDGQPGRN